MKINHKILNLVLICYPTIVFAEVSDKIPSAISILAVGASIGIGLIVSGQYRWWLNIVLLPVPILLIAENITFWSETVMRESIIREQGLIYFGALGMQIILMLGGAIIGIVFGHKRSTRKR